MKKILQILTFTALVISTSSHALEITPLLGYRGGGEFIDETNDKKHTIVSSSTYGFIISGEPYSGGKQFELYYSHQDSDINSISVTPPSVSSGTANIPLSVDYLHFGGTTPISKTDKLHSFVSGGLGFTYLSPDFTGFQSDLRASLSIGIGAKYALTKRIALRLESRVLATMFNNNSAIFCNGGCRIRVNGNFFTQGEVFAGVAFKF